MNTPTHRIRTLTQGFLRKSSSKVWRGIFKSSQTPGKIRCRSVAIKCESKSFIAERDSPAVSKSKETDTAGRGGPGTIRSQKASSKQNVSKHGGRGGGSLGQHRYSGGKKSKASSSGRGRKYPGSKNPPPKKRLEPPGSLDGRAERVWKVGPTASQRRLNEAIVAAEGAYEILDILQDLEDYEDLTSVNAATAFQRIAKHSLSLTDKEMEALRTDPRTEQLAAVVESFSGAWGGYAVSSIAWGHHALGHGLPSLPEKLWQRLQEKLPTMLPVEVGGALLAIAKCEVLTPAHFEKLSDPLVAWLDAQQEVLTERCINGILWPYAKAEYKDPVVLGRLAEHTKLCLQGTKVHTRGLANFAWCFAKAEYADEGLFDMLAGQVVARLSTDQPRVRGAKGFSAFDIGNFSWAFAKAYSLACGENPDYSRDDTWVLEYVMRVPVRLMVLKQIVARVPDVVDDLTAAGMSSLLWGLACIRYYDASLMDLLCRKVAQSSHTYTVMAISIIFWSLASLRYDAPKALEAMAATLLDMHKAGKLEELLFEQNLTMVVLACAHLDSRHLPTCQKLIRELAAVVSRSKTQLLQTSQGLSNLAWALSCLNVLDEGLFRQICIRLTRMDQTFERELTQIYQADLTLRLLPKARPSLEDTAAKDVWEFLEECFNLGRLKMASHARWRQVLHKNFRSVTDLHWDVATTLERLGGRFAVEFEAEDYSLDIAMADERIAIEVDGPVHYMRNTRRPLGFHVLKRTLLIRRGWKMVNIPYFEWNEQSTKSDKETYLLGALSTVGWSPPSGQQDDSDDSVVSSLAAEGLPQTRKRSPSEGESSETDSGDRNKSAGFGALSRADRLAVLKLGSSGLSRHQVLLKRAVQRKL